MEVLLLHEYGITQSIINIVSKTAEENNARSVKSITLVIGELSSIMDDSIQMYFDIISEGTVCRGAKLIFRRVAAELKCSSCGQHFGRKSSNFDCPYCGSIGRLTDVGKEFYIESIEVE